MPKHEYPLHHEDARPLYVEITQDEYDRLVKAEQELNKLAKKAFDFGCQVIDKESEARQTAIRWHIVATDGNPHKRGRQMSELEVEQWLDYAGEPKPCYPKSEADKVIAHQKRKRCLAMASLCHWKMGVFIYKKEKSDFYYRWHRRWLDLAEKFKEAK